MLYYYFSELQSRFFLLLFSSLVLTLFCLLYKDNLILVVIMPFSKNFLLKYIVLNELGQILEIYLGLVKFYLMHVWVTLLLYHIFLFVSPALNIVEYCKIKTTILKAYSFFLMVTIVFNFLFFPNILILSFKLLKNVSSNFTFYFEPHLISLFDFFISSYIFCILCYIGFIFLTFAMLNFLTKINQINKLKKITHLLLTVATFLIGFSEFFTFLLLFFCFILFVEIKIFSKIFIEVIKALIR